MKNIFLKTFIALLSIFSVTFASDECPMISTSQVGEFFNSNTVKFLTADSSGTCSWYVNDKSDAFHTNVIKQPSAKQASELFKTYEKTTFDKFTDYISRPNIADKAFIGMRKGIFTLPSGEKINEWHINLVVLSGDTIYTFFYDVHDQSYDNADTVAAVEKIGRIALSSSTKPKQSFSECAWFLPKELDKLLGKKGQVIQSLGDERCIAYATPGDGSLTAMGDSMGETRTFNLMKDMNKETCKVKDLPQFGKTAFAYYDCPAPATGAMSVEFLKNKHHMTVSYKPNGHRSTLKDLDAMQPLLEYIFKKL
jgi:hypothetical protein